MKFTSKTNPARLAIQIIVLFTIVFILIRSFTDKSYIPDFEAYCPYGGLLAFSSFMVNNTLACSMTSAQIAMGAVLILGIIIFSKLFCSFICPVGTVSEWLGKAGEKAGLRFTVTGSADILLRGIKYALLFLTFYFTIGSSELFCRKFDPYYAAVTGFSADVSLSSGILTIAIVIAGSFFIRLFWCKYICPIGAISNVFRFFITFVAVTGIYLILLAAGVKLSFVWPLAVICSIAYILEFYSLQSKTFPLFTIRRNTEICTNCKLCTKYCPQAISVAEEKDIKHIDCHLCGDCIHVCPEKGALTINRKGIKWLPAIVVAILIGIGFIAGKTFEIPTINEYWGEKDQKEKMSEYTRSGLKSVKCYGSSVAFSNQMKKVAGVTGVTTFVKTNTVIILYAPETTDTLTIQRAIFSPVKVLLRNPGAEITGFSEFSILIDNFFDPMDASYLQQLLMKNNDFYGFTTEFGCPVKVSLFTDAGSREDAGSITEIIHTRSMEQSLTNGKTMTINMNFKVKSIEKKPVILSREELLTRLPAPVVK
jgi:polyferredoxin